MDCVDKDVVCEERQEEILVLKAIFNGDFLPLDNAACPSAFDVIIHIDSLPSKILLIHEESNTSTKLSHLPPLILHIVYNQTYPQEEPPIYCILCDYLTENHLLILADSMDRMWERGEVIVYKWIEFLKDYFYNLNHQLLLPPPIQFSLDDKRFLTNYDKIGSKRVYDQLVEYDRVQNQLEFEQTDHTCPICLEGKSGLNCLQFEKCYHFACLSCLNNHANEYLSNIQYNKQINCYECDSSLFLSELRRIFSNDKLLWKYQQRLLEQTVDMVWCPRCHHSIICLPSESTSANHPSFVECNYCQFIFCRRCQETWHPQIECPKAKILQDIRENPTEKQTHLSTTEMKNILLEIENIQTIEQCTKPCPSCNVRIEKNGGCQHMSCRECQIHFCWICGWYARAYGPHACEQKPEKFQALLPSNINDKVDKLFHDQNGKGIQQAIARRIQVCPKENCRQAHIKIGTANTLTCEKCQTNFCFVCGEAIYGKFHFSDYSCKANTRV